MEDRQATKEQSQDSKRDGEGQSGFERQEKVESLRACMLSVGDCASKNISLYLSRIFQGAQGHDIGLKILYACALLIYIVVGPYFRPLLCTLPRWRLITFLTCPLVEASVGLLQELAKTPYS